MKYSIVMPCLLKDESHRPIVTQTIRSVKSGSRNYELIIVDDGSTLSTGFLKSESDTFIRHNGSNKGIAPSWNDGKNVSRGEYIVIINDDIRVPKDWLESMSDVFEDNPSCGVVGVMKAGPNCEPRFLNAFPVEDYKWFSGYCFMLKRDRFIKDFDEQFVPFNFEDIDYWERIQQSGLKMFKAPIEIWHAEGDTIHSMNYNETDNRNLDKFTSKWGFNPKQKYFG